MALVILLHPLRFFPSVRVLSEAYEICSPNQFSFPPGDTRRLHFPTSFAIRGLTGLSSGQWNVGRSNALYFQAWPLKFLARSFVLVFSSTCQENVAQGDLGGYNLKMVELPSRALPFTAYSLSACLDWDVCIKPLRFRGYLLLQLAVSLS